MKKYLRLIVLTLFIIGTISVFYITLAINAKKLPQFDIHTVAGDEQIKENIIITGMFGTNTFNEDLFRYEDGVTTYARYNSFINREKLFYGEQKIADLQNRYRNFMRGKDNDSDTFYENDQYVAYGNVTYDYSGVGDYKFDIDILDKETKKSVSFTHGIPNRNDYWSFELAHVQLIGDELKLITINDFTENSKLQEARLYTFDIHKKQLIKDEQLIELKEIKNSDTYSFMKVIDKEDPHSTEVALYLEQTETIDDVKTGAFTEETIDKQVILYDLVDQSMEKIDLLKDFDKAGMPFYINEDSLYFGTTLINKLNIEKYDLKKKESEKKLEVDTNISGVDRDNIIFAKISDGKLYYTPSFSTEYTDNPSVVVVDLKDMKTIYEGNLRLKNGDINKNMYLYLYPLETK